MEVIIVILLAYIAYKLYSNGRQQKSTSHSVRDTQELEIPYWITTPVRHYIFGKIKHSYDPNLQTDIGTAFYGLFSYSLISIFNDCNDRTGDPQINSRLASDAALLRFLPCYWYLLVTNSADGNYDSDLFGHCLINAAKQFMRDYCYVTGANYEQVDAFCQSKLEYYSNHANMVKSSNHMGTEMLLLGAFLSDISDTFSNGTHAEKQTIVNKITYYSMNRLPRAYESMRNFASMVLKNR